ncbi:MAG TPA: amidohydrolase family protein [Verrucomicrobiae bacterium]|nr:amidohydrolase family protein [Verrucomicrobiae bacterium]
MRIDAHQHFWSYDEAQYPWIPKGSRLHRDWLPADLDPLLAWRQMDGSVAVQARQTLEETRWLLSLADQNPSIKGVVGWVDLRSPRVEERLEELVKHPRLVGVRHVAQDEPDDKFLLQPEVMRGIGSLKRFGLTYDLLVYPRQLPAAIALARRLPEHRFVLDHIAKPPIRNGVMEPWDDQIRQLARSQNVYCKISGLITEANHQKWAPEEVYPYLDVVFEAFGTNRLMFGSDWPVCLLAGSYDRVYELVAGYTRGLAPIEQEAFFGGNAARFYTLRP